MRRGFRGRTVAAILLMAAAMPACAGNTLVPAAARVAVAKSMLTVMPDREWNRMGARPGRSSESWTLDGDTLNDLTFYGGIEGGRTLFREVDRRDRPLPRFSATMLITDVPGLLENSYRIALDTPMIAIDTVAPIRFAGHKGIRFTYSFSRRGEDVHRTGEARAAIVGGRLYMTTFEAPSLHYFDAGIDAARTVMGTATLAG